jgi:hypothetical protein
VKCYMFSKSFFIFFKNSLMVFSIFVAMEGLIYHNDK